MSKLNREAKHSITYVKDGEKINGYLLWNTEKGGFVLRRTTDDRILINTAFASIKEFRNAGYLLTMNVTKTRTKEPVAA